MKCVILQPSYIPWRGYFHQMQKADLFIFCDDVQYNTAGWRNRNRIKTGNGAEWLTIPVHSKGTHGSGRQIKDMEICWDEPWNVRHLGAIENAYRRAPYFTTYFPLLQEWYRARCRFLADFTITLSIALAGQLGVPESRFMRSAPLGIQASKTDRIVQMMHRVGADHYISGPTAKDYIEEDKLREAGITLEYMEYDYPEYPQLHGAFDPHISIVDLLFMRGPDAPSFIWAQAPVLERAPS
jgi:hypothetical protein